jgi:hypothetical protein
MLSLEVFLILHTIFILKGLSRAENENRHRNVLNKYYLDNRAKICCLEDLVGDDYALISLCEVNYFVP